MRSAWASLAGALLVALAVGSGPVLGQEAAPPSVLAYEIRSEEGLRPPEGLAGLVSLELGRPLDRARLRHSLRSLRAALEATEVKAHLRHVEGGVEVVFALWTGVRVREVRLSGKPCLEEVRLFARIDQLPSAPLSESRLLRGLYRLQDLHRDEGYVEARVRLQVEVSESKEAVVAYDIDCGEVATVGGVAFRGDRGRFTSAQLIDRLVIGPGDRYFAEAVRRDGQALEEWLIAEGFRLANVEEPTVEYDADTKQVHLIYDVDIGPHFEVRLSGADRSALERARVMPLQGLERFDEALLLRDVERLREHFQKAGHYRVEIETRAEELEGARRYWLLIEPGPIYRLRDVAWDPMSAVSETRLAELVETLPRRRFGGTARLVDKTLERDLVAVRSYLALAGFDRAEVGPPVVEESGAELSVRIPVEEGVQRRVVQIGFLGLESLTEPEARQLLRVREGGPFHPLLLDRSLDALRARYEELGFSRAQVAATLDWNEDRTLADVQVRVLEGARTVVERVILRGNRKTRSEPILRAVRLEAGEKVSRGDLLELQRRLYALGIFSSVDVSLAPGAPLSGRRDVIVRVREGSSRRFSSGVGWDSEDGFRTLVGLSHGNLFRRAINGRLDLRWSEREQQARLLFFRPLSGRFGLETTASLFAIEEMLESFTSKRRGFQFALARPRAPSRLNLIYTYKTVEAEPDAAFVALGEEELARILDIDRDLREVLLSSVRPAWLIDRRDDPVVPTRGWSSTLSVEYAFPFLGTDAEFVKGFSQQTLYRDLGSFGTAAASLRLGAIEPVGEPDALGALASREVPISERFFAGGRTTHRAYRRDRLGIRGDTVIEGDFGFVSAGGNGLVLANLDWRFPVAGPVGGVAFFDAGNVWSDWRNIDFDQLKSGAGLGVRYESPIGVVRLEIGWKLDREPDESPTVVFLSFGNPF